MTISFNYSLKEELLNLFDLIRNHTDYKSKGLFLVYPDLWECFSLMVNAKLVSFIIRNTLNKRSSIENAFHQLGLQPEFTSVKCYLHAFGCGGWFDPKKNEVHVRWDYHANRFIDTLLHELIHLITYKDNLSYKEREDIVNNYMNSPVIKEIVNG